MSELVSNSTQFNPAVTFIITQVYKDMSVIDEEETPSAPQFNTGLFALNAIVKTLQATGIHVWTEEEAIVFLQTGVAKYVFGGTDADTTAMACQADAWVQDQLQSSYLAGSDVFALPLQIAMAVGDNIGFQLDAQVMFWTTVTASAAGLVTTALSLPSSASSGNLVLDYPPSAQVYRPLKVPRARLYTYANGKPAGQGIVTPMTILSRQEYMDLPNPNQPGTPSQWFYDPRRSDGWLYFWLPPQSVAWGSRFTYYRSIQDFLQVNNTADFPQEWIQPLRWILAKDLSPGYGVPVPKWQIIKDNYSEAMDTVISWDRESEPVQFGIDWQQR